ncbi:MAG: polysaccharide pyruvyl transferase family protein [Anaerolineae bacterium]|nr:polysaccharide pyruvyl transferase family protein [Anaerolineae bacterium]MCO5203645.1 polysaccharide pyruvyl transferase family protein [Anaerolineae bacterium]
MRIGVIGWYGHDNAGDERILASLRRYFDGHELIVTRSFDDGHARLVELNECDYVLIGGGGLILRGSGRHSAFVEQIEPPLSCVGISVEAVHEDNQALIDVLLHKADVIYVRDARSRKLLNNHPKVVVGPDLTFLYPFAPADVVEDDVCGVNLRQWAYWPFEFRGRADTIMRKLDQRIPRFKRIYPFAKWQPQRAIDVLRNEFDELIPLSLYSEPGHVTDTRVLSNFFAQVKDAFDVHQLQQCRYLVAMRLHALIFACQMGIPFISLSYQPKNEEICRQLDMARFSVPLTDLSQLTSAVAALKTEWSQLREQMLDFTAAQHSKGHAIMREIPLSLTVGVK